ncbi:MAG: ribulose-phosphate 3-epimerase [Thermaerobacter sp.]|nr:ribulose-phosphate 3-epimerase [Thermaerobacter sp.]
MALIAPSILTADWLDLRGALKAARDADIIHLDVMDGHFVPNLTFGPPLVAAICEEAERPVECHLMVERPSDLLARYAEAGAFRLIVHAEATLHLHRLVAESRALGVEVGVALNPGSPLALVEEVAADVDLLLLMTVDPGFGGQSFLTGQLAKIREAKRRFPRLWIEVDGGIHLENARAVCEAGADILVAGSSVFTKDADPAARIEQLRAAAK